MWNGSGVCGWTKTDTVKQIAGAVTKDAENEAVAAVDGCGDVLGSTVVHAVVSGRHVVDSQPVLVHANTIWRRVQPAIHVTRRHAVQRMRFSCIQPRHEGNSGSSLGVRQWIKNGRGQFSLVVGECFEFLPVFWHWWFSDIKGIRPRKRAPCPTYPIVLFQKKWKKNDGEPVKLGSPGNLIVYRH